MSRGRSPATLSFSILSFSATYLSHRNHFECNLAQLLPHDGSSKWLYSRLQTSVLGILTVRVSCPTLSFLPVGSYVMVLSRGGPGPLTLLLRDGGHGPPDPLDFPLAAIAAKDICAIHDVYLKPPGHDKASRSAVKSAPCTQRSPL